MNKKPERTCRQRDANEDAPKSLGIPAVREARRRSLREAHVAPLTSYVKRLRGRTGKGKAIPFFDPFDGGTQAECLFVFEAPGRMAKKSGFVSRNNPDESASNFFKFNRCVGLDRSLTASWNIVPWYVGSGRKIRAVRAQEVKLGESHLLEVIRLFPHLRIIVMGGKKAQRAWDFLEERFPSVRRFAMPHPSPRFVNRSPGNKGKILRVLRKIVNEIA